MRSSQALGKEAGAQVGHLRSQLWGPEAQGALSHPQRVAWALEEQPAAGEAALCEYRK